MLHLSELVRRRRSLAFAAVLAVLTALATASTLVASAPATGAGGRPAHHFGYPIRATPSGAVSGFVGSWRIGRQTVYKVTPRASAIASRYRHSRKTGDWDGRRGAGPISTGRAAYILTVYGRYGGAGARIQDAAVDAAVLQLLAGRKWSMKGAYGRRRLHQIADGATIRSWARQMITDAVEHAGPYKTRLRVTRVDAGKQARATFSIHTVGGHHGVGGISVLFIYPNQATKTVKTDEDGTASVTFTAAAGTRRVYAVAMDLRDWRVTYRRPTNAQASTVVIGGRHYTTQTTHAFGYGVTDQRVGVIPAATPIFAATPIGGTVHISGGAGSRTLILNGYGPFTTAGGPSAGCPSGTPSITRSVTIVGRSASVALPVWQPGRTGYYVWSAHAAGNDVSRPGRGCSPPIRVRKHSTVTQARDGSATKVTFATRFGITVGIGPRPWDRTESHTVSTRLYGPFSTARGASCGAGRHVAGQDKTVTVTGAGSYSMPKVAVAKGLGAGYFVFRTSVAAGPFYAWAQSTCGIAFHVVSP